MEKRRRRKCRNKEPTRRPITKAPEGGAITQDILQTKTTQKYHFICPFEKGRDLSGDIWPREFCINLSNLVQ